MTFSLTPARLSGIFLAMVFASLLSACGQKGPLFLPTIANEAPASPAPANMSTNNNTNPIDQLEKDLDLGDRAPTQFIPVD